MSKPQGTGFMRPLKLPGHMMPRRKSDASDSAPPLTAQLPPVPSIPTAYLPQAPVPPSATPLTPPLKSPSSVKSAPANISGMTEFRLLPPLPIGTQAVPPEQPWPESDYAADDFPSLNGSDKAWQRPRRTLTYAPDRRLEMELRQKPLPQSLYGRCVVSLLMQQWVIAPSGLAACIIDDVALPGMGEDPAMDLARFVNLLVCGAEAFAEPCTGLLAIRNLAKLNRLFVKCGLSPVAPAQMPPAWAPLSARQPPSFLLPSFNVPTSEVPDGSV